MDKLKNMLSGKSDDTPTEQQPSGKLTGEGSHMPGSWDNEEDPGQIAAKGSGISSNPAAATSGTTNPTSTPFSNEAAKGSGISSALGGSGYSPNVGSHMASSQGQTNPDSMAAATTALGGSSTSGTHGATGELQSSSTASGQYSGSSAPGIAGQSVPHDVSSTSRGLNSSTAGSSAPIADSFTSSRPSADTTYAGGSAPGVAGQSVPHEAAFSSTGNTGHSSTLGAGAVGAGAGALTGQSLTDRSRATDTSSAAVAPSYTERAQHLEGNTSTSSAGPLGTTGTTSSAGLASTSSGTTVSKPFPSDPVSTEPLGGSSHVGRNAGVTAAGIGATGLAAHEAGQYTGDSRDYNSGSTASNPGLGGSSTAATTGYTGSSAPGVAGQSVPQSTGVGSSTKPTDSEHHYGRDAAALGGAGALGTAAASHEKHQDSHTPVIKDMRTGEPKGISTTNQASIAPLGGSGHHYHGHDAPGQGKDEIARERQGSKVLKELDILPQQQQSPFHNTTTTGHTAKDEYYGGASASAPTGTSSSGHTGRNVAAGVGAAAAGAGGVGAYEASKAHDTKSGTGSTSNTASGYGDQYAHTASGTPSGIAVSDPAHPSSSDRTTAASNTPSSAGIGSSNTSSGHHYGRDAAAVAGIGGAGALGAHEYSKDRTGASSGLTGGAGQSYSVASSHDYSGTGPTAGGSNVTAGISGQEARAGAALPSTQEKRETASSPDTYTQQVATAEAPYQNKPYYQAASPASHHSGHDAALVGGAGAVGAGAYEATKGHGASSTGQSGLSSDSTGLTTGSTGHTGLGSGSAGGLAGAAGQSSGSGGATSSSQGYGDQYGHTASGTPSGIAPSDPAHGSGLSSSGPQSSGTGTSSNVGRDAALAGGVGAGGAGLYNQSRQQVTGQSGLDDTATHAGSSDHHYGRDAAIGGAGIAGTGAAAYGLHSQEKGAVGASGTTNTAGTTDTTGATSGTTTSKPTIAATGHAHDSSAYHDDEPDSPTGTGESKKKRGFLSKLLHRDDPNKLHKDPPHGKSSEGADVPRTTPDAYGSATDGKATHIGTDGEIGQHGQSISGYGNTDARQALPLSEAEKLLAQQKH